jgi:hypothetical protein
VLTYGCSFTHGDDVIGRDTWPAQLERAARDVRVTNFGVGAYGLGQALLRMRTTAAAQAPDEIWFALLPFAALRATTCYRPLIRPWSTPLAFKPRFRAAGPDGLDLEWIENPAADLADVLALTSDAGTFLDRMEPLDPWVARCADAFAPRGSRWTHAFATTRLWLTMRFRKGPVEDLALAGPDAPAFAVQRALAFAAKQEAQALGARFRYVVLPGKTDLRALEQRGSAPWAPFLEELERLGIEVLDLTETVRALGPEAFLQGRGGHYAPEGNARVARFLLEHLDDPPR